MKTFATVLVVTMALLSTTNARIRCPAPRNLDTGASQHAEKRDVSNVHTQNKKKSDPEEVTYFTHTMDLPPGTEAGHYNESIGWFTKDHITEPHDWYIILKYTSDFGVPVDMSFFYGPPPAKGVDFRTAPNLLGQAPIKAITPSDHGKKHNLIHRRRAVSITAGLAGAKKDGALESLEIGPVTAFLRNNLRWKATADSGRFLIDDSVFDKWEMEIWEQDIDPATEVGMGDWYGEMHLRTELVWGSGLTNVILTSIQ